MQRFQEVQEQENFKVVSSLVGFRNYIEAKKRVLTVHSHWQIAFACRFGLVLLLVPYPPQGFFNPL